MVKAIAFTSNTSTVFKMNEKEITGDAIDPTKIDNPAITPSLNPISTSTPMAGGETPVEKTKVKVFENGPVRVLGPCEITLADGTVIEKPNGISFCRCGASTNMPFCDASHKNNGYKG